MGHRFFIFIVSLLYLHTATLADTSKTIFDDDWTPPPQQIKPTVQTPPNQSAPAPATEASSDPKNSDSPASALPPAALVPQLVRLTVPSAATQADSWKLIRDDIYRDDIGKAKTPSQKAALAQKLMNVATATKEDPVGKYVLLAQAKELAISSGDPETAFKCLDELGHSYLVDYPAMKFELFTALGKTTTSPTACQIVAEGLNHWADGQVKADRYDVAKSAVQLATGMAQKSTNVGLIQRTKVHQQQIDEIEAAYRATRAARAGLHEKPDDPALNLAMGRYLCFMKGDWTNGLPMLSHGADPILKELANNELVPATDAQAELTLGDNWWKLMEKEKGVAQERIREHAISWYRISLPHLEGLAKAKAEKRAGTAHTELTGEGSVVNEPPKAIATKTKYLWANGAVVVFTSDGTVTNDNGKVTGNWKAEGNEIVLEWTGGSKASVERLRVENGGQKLVSPRYGTHIRIKDD